MVDHKLPFVTSSKKDKGQRKWLHFGIHLNNEYWIHTSLSVSPKTLSGFSEKFSKKLKAKGVSVVVGVSSLSVFLLRVCINKTHPK